MTLDHWTGLVLQSNHEPLQKGEFCNTACILINTTTLLRSRPGKMNTVISYNYTDKVISLLSHGTNQRLSDSTQ